MVRTRDSVKRWVPTRLLVTTNISCSDIAQAVHLNDNNTLVQKLFPNYAISIQTLKFDVLYYHFELEMEGQLFNQSISLFHFPILPSFCCVLCTVSFTSSALSAAVALNHISLVDLCPFIPHDSSPSFMLYCFSQWFLFFLCITYLLLIFSNNTLPHRIQLLIPRNCPVWRLLLLFLYCLSLSSSTRAVVVSVPVVLWSDTCPQWLRERRMIFSIFLDFCFSFELPFWLFNVQKICCNVTMCRLEF